MSKLTTLEYEATKRFLNIAIEVLSNASFMLTTENTEEIRIDIYECIDKISEIKQQLWNSLGKS